MKQYIISIVYNDYIIETIATIARSENQAGDQAFDYANQYGPALIAAYLGHDKSSYNPELVELYFKNNPRHDILFKDTKLARNL